MYMNMILRVVEKRGISGIDEFLLTYQERLFSTESA
jgi:hypothetical protein